MPVPHYVLLAALATGTPVAGDAGTALTLGADVIVQPNGGTPTRLACGGVVQKDADCGGGGGGPTKIAFKQKEKEGRHVKERKEKPAPKDTYLRY
jgi:hypothetical protein